MNQKPYQMKSLLFYSLLCFSLSSIAQAATESPADTSKDSSYTCEQLVFNPETQELMLIGDVSFRMENIELKHAEKVVYNKRTREITATGLNEFTFSGTIEMAKKPKNKRLSYKVGDQVAYID